jgi:hypothetical protein
MYSFTDLKAAFATMSHLAVYLRTS